jgi:hypothetical protein
MTPAASFLGTLKAAAEGAAIAETEFRRQAADRTKALERERAFAFRRLNLMRAVAEAVAAAESEEIAVAASLALLRSRLGWSSDSDARSEVLSRFSPVAAAVFACLAPLDGETSAPDVTRVLEEFEAWYAATRATPFWALFEQYVAETPVVDF